MIAVDITNSFGRYAESIWAAEMSSPRIQRDAVLCWLPDYEAFCSFADKECDSITGYFEDDVLKFVVYLERERDDKHIVHFSVLESFNCERAVEHLSVLRDKLFRRGVKIIDGFVLSKNYGLQKLMKRIGFARTELEMRYGASHGRSLKWSLFRIARI